MTLNPKKIKQNIKRRENDKKRIELDKKMKQVPAGAEVDEINARFSGNSFVEEIISSCSPLEDIEFISVDKKRVEVSTVFPQEYEYPPRKIHKLFTFEEYGYNNIDLETAREMLFYIASKAFYKGFDFNYSLSPYNDIMKFTVFDSFSAYNKACISMEKRRKNF